MIRRVLGSSVYLLVVVCCLLFVSVELMEMGASLSYRINNAWNLQRDQRFFQLPRTLE